MRSRDALARLLDLRKLREQRARETVVSRQQSASAAAEKTRQAMGAIDGETHQAAVEEGKAFSAVAGGVVSTGSMREMQHRFAAAAGRLRALEAQAGEAKAVEEASQDELSSARDTHRRRRLGLEKLESIIEQQAARARRAQAAHVELSDEEQVDGLRSAQPSRRA